MQDAAARRLFIAAQLPDAFLPALEEAGRVLSRNARSLRLTKPENLHLTLVFLGEVRPQTAQEVISWFGDMPPLTPSERMTSLTGYGAFPGRDGLTLWAGLFVTRALRDFAARLADGARAMGVPVDRRAFLPHVTLARSAHLMRPLDVLTPTLPLVPPAPLPAITLFQSTFTKNGMLYTPLRTI